MSLWKNNTLGFVPNEDWLNVGFKVNRPNEPADAIFGDIRTENLVAAWESIASEYQLPMMAQFHAFDVESQKTFRVPIDTHNVEKGLIKVKINQSERLRALLTRGVTRETALYDYVLNDGIRLADQVFTRSKVAKNELLATGKVTIKENNVELTVDYGVPDANTSLTLDFSKDATSTILDQIEAIVQGAKDKGTIIDGIYTSSNVINAMRKDINVQKTIYGNNGAGRLVKRSDLETYLNDEFGISTVLTNDYTYGKTATFDSNDRPVISSARYYPTNKITFFATNPGGKIGEGLWGDPPETDLAKFMNVGTEPSVSPYVRVSQYIENDPAVIWTKASALFMPVLFNPTAFYVATVTFESF